VGGLAFTAGLRSSSGTSSCSAASSAALRISWTYRTVRADSGSPVRLPSWSRRPEVSSSRYSALNLAEVSDASGTAPM
jgi:hypothetical protein